MGGKERGREGRKENNILTFIYVFNVLIIVYEGTLVVVEVAKWLRTL